MLTALDTSVVIAALLSWHEWHAKAAAAVDRLMAADQILLPLPVLIESFSVMTRLPHPHRLSGGDALEVLRSFTDAATAGFPTRRIWSFLASANAKEMIGGRVYDAVIVECAIAGEARRLLTFNSRDFALFDERIEVVEPG
ncbi:MAG TPA: PIN domain-containing protein [Thermoanaerobaculia bacterium]|nr:PIN domain-containing protein [Thermoanaerobaculia bacterium]